jgi:hypothetical protein
MTPASSDRTEQLRTGSKEKLSLASKHGQQTGVQNAFEDRARDRAAPGEDPGCAIAQGNPAVASGARVGGFCPATVVAIHADSPFRPKPTLFLRRGQAYFIVNAMRVPLMTIKGGNVSTC